MALWRFFKAPEVHNTNTGLYALDANYQVQKPMLGSGIAARRIFAHTAPANLQVASLTVQTGYGGLAQGQVALQPLSDPYHGGMAT